MGGDLLIDAVFDYDGKKLLMFRESGNIDEYRYDAGGSQFVFEITYSILAKPFKAVVMNHDSTYMAFSYEDEK